MYNPQIYVEMAETIHETLDKKRYPETDKNFNEFFEVLDDLVDLEEGLYQLAYLLHNSDETEVLPNNLGQFIMDLYEELDKSGDSNGALNIGSLYYTGRAGVQDYLKAEEYYLKAAAQNNPIALENLGYFYYYGRGSVIDYKKAYHFFIKGALKQSVTSIYKIADMYKNGYYVDKDEALAFELYWKCFAMAEEQEEDCIGEICIRIADALYKGIGTEVDLPRAFSFYQQAEFFLYLKLKTGDFYAQKAYRNAKDQVDHLRVLLQEQLPDYNWAKIPND